MDTTTSIVIRPAHRGDLARLVSFNMGLAMETESRQLDRRRLEEGVSTLLEAPEKGYYLVAQTTHRQDPAVIGQLMVTFEWSDWRNGTFWWIQSVYVHPDWRRQGVFRLLHAAVLERAQAQEGVCGIRLYVEHENHIAQTAYAHVGLALVPYRMYETDFTLNNSSEP